MATIFLGDCDFLKLSLCGTLSEMALSDCREGCSLRGSPLRASTLFQFILRRAVPPSPPERCSAGYTHVRPVSAGQSAPPGPPQAAVPAPSSLEPSPGHLFPHGPFTRSPTRAPLLTAS